MCTESLAATSAQYRLQRYDYFLNKHQRKQRIFNHSFGIFLTYSYLFASREVTFTRKYKEKRVFLWYFAQFALTFRFARSYFHSKMKRKINFPFAFCSFIRNFVTQIYK